MAETNTPVLEPEVPEVPEPELPEEEQQNNNEYPKSQQWDFWLN